MNINQISVFLENRAGQLAEVINLLAENNINLRAIYIAETDDYGLLRMIVDDAESAASILLANGNVIKKTPISVVSVPDRPAGLSEVLAPIAEANVNILYMYSILSNGSEKAYMVFRTDDDDKLAEVIKSAGLSLATKSELGIK